MFSGDDSQMHIILKEKDPKTGKAKTNGKIYSYITLRTYDPETDNGKPLKIIDLNSFPEIQDARFFEGTETQNVIYYATSTKIYSINLAIANPLVTLEYTAPEGEEITSMMAWKEYQGKVDYTNPNPNADADDKVIEVSNNNRMIVLSTYNPQAGKGSSGLSPSPPWVRALWRRTGNCTASSEDSAALQPPIYRKRSKNTES